MQKIRWQQLTAIAIAIRVFTLMCTSAAPSVSSMLGIAISTLAQSLLLLPMLTLYKKGTFPESKTLTAVYALFFVAFGASALVNLLDVMQSIYFPVQSKLFAWFILAAASLYAARLGLRALGRAAVLSVGLIAAALAIMLLGSLPRLELSALNPPDKSVWCYALNDFCRSGELAALFILMGFTENGNPKAVRRFIALRLIITELITFIGAAVLGVLSVYYKYPFFAIGAYSQPFRIQRADGIYTVLLTVLCVISITVQVFLAAMLLKKILPKVKQSELIVILAMLLTSVAIGCTEINIYALCGVMLIALTVAVPIITLIYRKAAVR